MGPLYDKILAADALIVGPVVYFGKANAFTHTFLERLFPLRHVKMLTKGKIAAVVAVGSNGAERCVNEVVSQSGKLLQLPDSGVGFFQQRHPALLQLRLWHHLPLWSSSQIYDDSRRI